jgi:hypothetical protein
MELESVHHQDRSTPSPAGTVLTQAARQLRQFMCGLHGHDTLLHFDNQRVSLQCVSCGYESPGWTVPGGPAARGRASSQPAQTGLRERRIA